MIRRSERGTASLELLGMLPILILLGSCAFQAAVAMWTAASTNEAARSAARAYSLGHDPAGAAAGSLPGNLRVGSLSTLAAPAHGISLRVDVPRVSPLPGFDVTRTAVLP